jgi:hypothetical protein
MIVSARKNVILYKIPDPLRMNPTMSNRVIPNLPIDQLTRRFCPRLWLALALGAFCCAHAVTAETRRLARDQLLDKIKGGWAGQMIGVSFGAPTEFNPGFARPSANPRK